MKTTKLVLLAGLCLFVFASTKLSAQVKIGDDPLEISDNRLLEIQSGTGGAAEYFLVKDTTGITVGRADNLHDPLMLKLFGYGQGSSPFLPGGGNGARSYFLGTNANNIFN